MSTTKYLSLAEMNEIQRRLREYGMTYPDSEFLDGSLAYADSGRVFTRDNAVKIDDALVNWQRRLNSPSWDPDRVPAGRDPLVWQLATIYRDEVEAAGWTCMSRRIIYAELTRVIDRDKLREDCSPWRDETGEPGWYRMLRDVIVFFVREYTDANAIATWYAHEQLARPGEAAGIISYLRDQARLSRFDDHATPVNQRETTAERRARVKAYIDARKATRGRTPAS